MLCILVNPFNINVSVMGLQFWNCCWSWGIPSPPRAAAPATPLRRNTAWKWMKWMPFTQFTVVYSLVF